MTPRPHLVPRDIIGSVELMAKQAKLNHIHNDYLEQGEYAASANDQLLSS